MNGDLLTTLDYRAMLEHHRERGAIATVACYQRDVKIDLGVIEVNADNWVANYIEKPTYHYTVSMGIYVFEPAILNYIPRGEHLDLPELVKKLLRGGQRVNVFNFDGYWLDVGRHDDYERAMEEFARHRQDFLPEK
jgi:NDP-sugar pyrophosphorylase family protein